MNAPSPRAASAGDRDSDTAASLSRFTITITGSGAHTAQTFALAVYVIPPHGGSVQMHSHDHTAEWLYVVDGMVACALGEQTVTLAAGMVIVVPPSVTHAFWNPTPASATVVSLSAPAGCEHFFAELAPLRIAGGRAPPEGMGEPQAWPGDEAPRHPRSQPSSLITGNDWTKSRSDEMDEDVAVA